MIKVKELPKLSSTSRQAVWGLLSSWISHPNSAAAAGLREHSNPPESSRIVAGLVSVQVWRSSLNGRHQLNINSDLKDK